MRNAVFAEGSMSHHPTEVAFASRLEATYVRVIKEQRSAGRSRRTYNQINLDLSIEAIEWQAIQINSAECLPDESLIRCFGCLVAALLRAFSFLKKGARMFLMALN